MEMPKCDPKNCDSCLADIRYLSFAEGSRIVDFGEPPKGLYFIKEGLVKLEISSPKGTIFTLRIAKTTDFFGYRSLLSDEPYYYSATALSDSTVCLISRNRLNEMLAKDPELSLAIMRQLAKDLKTADKRWIDQACEEVPARVARILKDLHAFIPQHKLSKKEIAQIAGTTTETVFRSIAKLKKVRE